MVLQLDACFQQDPNGPRKLEFYVKFLDDNDTPLKDACKCNNDNAWCTHVRLG